MTSAAERSQRPPDGGPGTVRPPLESLPGFAAALAVAEAVLYEGYLLYPYRQSSAKNQVRWQFGVLAPRDVVEEAGDVRPTVAGSADSCRQQTEILLEAPDDAVLHVRLRFLQLQQRVVQRSGPDGAWQQADAVEVDGRRYTSFDEAVPREFDVSGTVGELRGDGRTVTLPVPGAGEVEELREAAGAVVGRLVRRSLPFTAVLRVQVRPAAAPFPLSRVRVDVENAVRGLAPNRRRAEVLRRSLVAAHTLLGIDGGRFLSVLDPPEWAAPAAASCTNLYTFPVLAGSPGGHSLVLSSPIILYDHPRIAPESPGQLFDAGEIDEILSLRTLTLTEAEKSEARATDPRAAALVDRVDAIPGEVLARLHGAVRSLRPVPPEPGSLVVDGVRIGPGSRVRLRPRRHGTDAQDLFLAGRTATVDTVLDDVDGSRFVAVTLDDDPGADLLRWYGRHYHFAPDEIEALP